MELQEWHSDEVTIEVEYATCVGHGDCADACLSDVYTAFQKYIPTY